jgi:hypothetical protein
LEKRIERKLLMYKILIDVIAKAPFLSGFLTGNVTGAGGTVIGRKLWKLAKYKLTGKRK